MCNFFSKWKISQRNYHNFSEEKQKKTFFRSRNQLNSFWYSRWSTSSLSWEIDIPFHQSVNHSPMDQMETRAPIEWLCQSRKSCIRIVSAKTDWKIKDWIRYFFFVFFFFATMIRVEAAELGGKFYSRFLFIWEKTPNINLRFQV